MSVVPSVRNPTAHTQLSSSTTQCALHVSVCAQQQLALMQTQNVCISGWGWDRVNLGPHGEEAVVEVPEAHAQQWCGRERGGARTEAVETARGVTASTEVGGGVQRGCQEILCGHLRWAPSCQW